MKLATQFAAILEHEKINDESIPELDAYMTEPIADDNDLGIPMLHLCMYYN